MSKPYTGSCSDNAVPSHACCEMKMPDGKLLLKEAEEKGIVFPSWARGLIRRNKFSGYSFETTDRRFNDRIGYKEPEMLKWIEFDFDNYTVKFKA
jgi:hypothetical protein